MSRPFKSSDLGLYLRALRQGRAYWPHIIALFLLSLCATPLSLLGPLPLKIAVDTVLGSTPLPGFLAKVVPAAWTTTPARLLWLAVGLMVGIRLVGRLRGVLQTLLNAWTTERLALDFRSTLFRKAQQLSLAYHDRSGPADSMYRIQSDSQAIEYLAMYGVIPLVTAAVTMVSMVYVSWRIDRTLALISLLTAPVLFVLALLHRRPLRRLSREAKQRESVTMSVLHEALSALRVVKAFGREDHEKGRFMRRSWEAIRVRLRLAWTKSRLGILAGVTIALGNAAVLYVGVRHVQTGVLQLGELLMVMAYLRNLLSPLQTMGKLVASLQSFLASAERAFAILDAEPEVPEHPNPRALPVARGAIAFENVSFEYGPERPVLQDVTFELAAGQRLGIAGPTGAGKTTLISLLMRFYDPANGRILLDGVDLREYRLADLRAQYGLVLQEPVLFSASITDNIAYGRPQATEEEIAAAARAANAHDFISALPQGYDTPVGERGQSLSGGERQRVALARAFLRNAPILILDEPTSSVDVGTERLIIEAMDRLMRGRTTFMIAHRLGTLQNCDRLLVLEQGQVASLEHDVQTAIRRGSTTGWEPVDPIQETVDD